MSKKERTAEFTNPDEENEKTTAALILLEISHTILDPGEALSLQKAIRNNKHKNQCRFPESRRSLSPAVQRIMGECSFPFEKQLKESDLKKDQMRLLLKYNHVNDYIFPMLSPLEIEKIKNQGIRLCVYDFRGKIYEMIFKLWGTKAYVLTSRNWINFCNDHNLVKDEHFVTLRMFRHVETSELCCVIVYERKALSVSANLKKKIKNGSKKRRRNDEEEERRVRIKSMSIVRV